MAIGTSRITSKGQLTIPQEIREKRGMKTGTSVLIVDTEEGVLIKKATDFKEIFKPFREIAKKEKLTRKKLAREISDEKKRTLKAFEQLKR